MLTARLADASIWLTRSETMTVLVARACASAVLALVAALLVAFVLDVRGARRRARGPAGGGRSAPLTARPAVDWALDGFWSFIHGRHAPHATGSADLGRRSSELLGENLTQPGYRELLIAVHDLDTRRDVIFGLVGGDSRLRLFGPRTAATTIARKWSISGEAASM